MTTLDTGSILTGLRHARREAIMSWDGEETYYEAARHLLNALLDVELAIVALEKDEERRTVRRTDENANDAGVRRTVRQTSDDDEPAAGDIVEAPSEVSRLARALQSKARPQ